MVCVPCIAEQGTSICEHIGRYYKEIADEPPLYFQFASEQLPPEAELHWEQTDAGDVCHYSICGLNDKTARKWFKQAAPALEGFYICPGDGVSRPLHANDIADWP